MKVHSQREEVEGLKARELKFAVKETRRHLAREMVGEEEEKDRVTAAGVMMKRMGAMRDVRVK